MSRMSALRFHFFPILPFLVLLQPCASVPSPSVPSVSPWQQQGSLPAALSLSLAHPVLAVHATLARLFSDFNATALPEHLANHTHWAVPAPSYTQSDKWTPGSFHEASSMKPQKGSSEDNPHRSSSRGARGAKGARVAEGARGARMRSQPVSRTKENSPTGLGAREGIQAGRRKLEVALSLPPSSANRTNGTLIILAPDRTRRANPLNSFSTYTGGWDFLSADYWASLAWTTFYGAAIGILWALFGLGFVMFLLLLMLCFRGHWRYLRDGSPRYTKEQLTLPLVVMIFGVILECIGLGLMVAGAVMMNETTQSLTQFTSHEVNKVANIVLDVTPSIRKLATMEGVLNISLPEDKKAKLLSVADKAEAAASLVLNETSWAQSTVNHAIKVLEEILFILGCITVGVVFIGMVFGLCKFVVLSNIMTVVVWTLCLVTWILVTVFLFIWLFEGDTAVAMRDIAADPTDLSKFNLLVPCMDPSTLDNLFSFARFSGSSAILAVNATIATKAPVVFDLLKTPNGLCNPFGPPPDYKYNNATCANLCPADQKFCTGNLITAESLSQKLPDLKCNSTITAHCEKVAALRSALTRASNATQDILQGLQRVLPVFKEVMHCAYIGYLTKSLADYVQQLEKDSLLLWLGFLFISMGAIFFSICLPIYVYRAVRCFVGSFDSKEMEPIAYSGALEGADFRAAPSEGHREGGGTHGSHFDEEEAGGRAYPSQGSHFDEAVEGGSPSQPQEGAGTSRVIENAGNTPWPSHMHRDHASNGNPFAH